MYRIAKEIRFEASHQLDGLPDDHKCSHNHGHSYKLILYFESETLTEEGWIIDFGELNRFKKEYIDYPKGVDHKFLNDYLANKLDYDGGQTTAENLAKWFYVKGKEMFPQLLKVRLWETSKCWAEYWEDSSNQNQKPKQVSVVQPRFEILSSYINAVSKVKVNE